MKEKIHTCNQNAFCCSVSHTLQQRLCRGCLHLRLKPKQEILFEGSSRQAAVITGGVVISVFLTTDGKQHCAEMLKRGDLLGVDNLFDRNKAQTGYLMALTDVSLCLFPIEVFQSLYQQSPEFAKEVLGSLTARLHKSLQHQLYMRCASSEDKVRTILDYLESESIDTSYLTHEDLAMIADLNRVTVTRAIKTIHELDYTPQ